ncbi:MAG: UPF0179 family protein [Candidatus Heimdallarchaeaceae archaeon]|jgi:uncharacterized protein (UPF0179 family)
MVVTLLPRDTAKIGYQFTHLGKAQVCNQCSLLKVCVDVLKENFSYQVTEVRAKEHMCLIDNQVMLVCNVEEASDIISVRKQKFLENILLNRAVLVCNEILCQYYDNCISPVYIKQEKVKIVNIIKDIECPLKYDLVLVEAKKISN